MAPARGASSIIRSPWYLTIRVRPPESKVKMSTEPKRTGHRNRNFGRIGLHVLFLVFLAALATPGLPLINAQSPSPFIDSALLDNTVPPGEYLFAGFILRNFPCVDEDYDNDCDYDDNFTSVTYRFDIMSRSDSNPDICEGQGLNRDRIFTPVFYNTWRRVSRIPLRINRECQPGPYTLKLTVTYTEADQETRATLTDTVDFDVGDPQPPTATPTATATQTPEPQPPTATPTATPTAKRPSEPKQSTATPTATPTAKRPSAPRQSTATPTTMPTAAQPSSPQQTTATPTTTVTPTQTPIPLQPADLPGPTPTSTPGEPPDDGSKSARPTPTPTSQWRSPCIVPHPATPVQVCRNRIGALHFRYVGNGMIFSGPIFDPIGKTASAYPFGHVPPEVELYRGINPGTGKEVVIHYLTYNRLLRVSTTYADNKHDVNKPYIFTIDEQGNIKHLTW